MGGACRIELTKRPASAGRACADAGYKIAVPEREIRPGVSIAVIEDLDRNWVELLSQSDSQTS